MTFSYDVLLHVPTLGGGGAERVAVELARHFVKLGLSTAMFVHDDKAKYDIPAEVEIFRAVRRSHIGRVIELKILLKKVKPTVVLSFLPYANLISLFANFGRDEPAKVVVSEHISYENQEPVKWKEKIKILLLNRLYRRASSIVAVSIGVANELKLRVGAAAADRIKVIYNPCFIEDGWQGAPSSVRSTKTILAVGRLSVQKGFDVLIRAFADVHAARSDTKLIIMGEGEERESLHKLVRALNLDGVIEIPGFSRNIGEMYRRADVFVCSSRFEGFGNVLVEAMSYGLPIVSTECKHGPREILDDGVYGELVSVDDSVALSGAILKVLETSHDPAQQIERAKHFSIDTIGRQYLEVMGLSA